MDTLANSHTFAASFIDITVDTFNDGMIYILSLADDNFAPENYIIIQYSSLINKQDVKLGQDKEYFLSSFIDGGYYGIVKCIHIYNNKIYVYIHNKDNDARSFIGTFPSDQNKADNLYKQLLSIHKETGCRIDTRRM